MVGIVIVSHSAEVAEGVRLLADQMVHGQVRMATAGGIEDPDNPFGTDAVKIYEAIESVYDDDGVVLLMDLGSALLNAEVALDLLPDDRRERVRMTAAPLVEGVVSAAVAASIGHTLENVLQEAERALEPKMAHLQQEPASFALEASQLAGSAGKEIRLEVDGRFGLHARPAAALVYVAARYRSRILVRNLDLGRGPADATSINQLAALDVRPGHRIAVSADGVDADAALAAIKALAELNFGEPSDGRAARPRTPVSVPTLSGELVGTPVAPGIAIGPVHVLRRESPTVAFERVGNATAESERLAHAIGEAREHISGLFAKASVEVGRWDAAIFKSHLSILDDPSLLAYVGRHIEEDGMAAERAWQLAMDEAIAELAQLESPYMRERTADLEDVKTRVLHQLAGEVPAMALPNHPVILVADELAPSFAMQLDPDFVLGVCTRTGGATSHAAILVRGLGIPAVFGAAIDLDRLTANPILALDGDTGQVWVDPGAGTRERLEAQREAWLAERQRLRALGSQPAVTRDGHRVAVAANVATVAEARTALDCGADGIGLLRTEFLFMDRESAPSEDEQVGVLAAIGDVMEGRELVVRTLDVGGDKPLPYLHLAPESNPFLGVRGIRMCLENTGVFKTHLRAILRSAAGRDVRIMFPMVSSVAEIREARGVLEAAQDELRQEGVAFQERVSIGIMIEVPSAVIMADQLASEVDFFSIGTNDLSQYAVAADRTNADVSELADAFHPAVLRMIRHTVEAAHAAGIRVSVCGELAGDPLATSILVGLHVDELSMAPAALATVKGAVRQLSLAEGEAIAAEALALPSAADVRAFLRDRVAHIA